MDNQTKKGIAGAAELIVAGIATVVATVTATRGKNNLFGNSQNNE